MRLAWFSPLPPVRSGVATYSAGLVAALRREHDIDVFVDEPVARMTTLGRSAHDFVWLHRQRPYDLPVYQLGNSSHHDYAWPYLFRYPGLTVLHDAHLHHARAAALLREKRAGDYRAEFAANEPGTHVDAAELAVAGFDSFLYYQAPFTRLAVSASRMTAVHSRPVQDDLRAAIPGAAVEHIRMGHGSLVEPRDTAPRRARARARHQIPDDALVFGVFGALTPEKRLPQILAAFEALLPYAPSSWLLLAGGAASHYDVQQAVQGREMASKVVLTGYLETDDDLTDCIAAADVALNLRWPTAREVSGPWVRCLAAGRATVVIDLSHTADVPSLDPRTWTATNPDGAGPVCVALDIMDEDHSLRIALRRLAGDEELRASLGAAARAYWTREHSHAAMLEDYRRVLPAAAAAAAPGVRLPPHLREDGSRLLTDILGHFGVPVPWGKG
jgi:glycosyltransferase involved in cell wall biosynthesis